MSGNNTVYEAASGKAEFLKDPDRRYEVVKSDQPLVVYHANCADGFTAAWACWEKNPSWEYRPMAYSDNGFSQLLKDALGRDVYFLDFCLSRLEMWQIGTVANKLVVLDHHKTAEAALAGFEEEMDVFGANVEVVFDMERSGAGIAWDYFWPGKPRPALVDVVEDRDLWRFQYWFTKNVMAYIFSFDYTFENWMKLHFSLRHSLYEKEQIGASLVRKHEKDIRELLKGGRRTMTIGGVEVPVCNLPYTMSSEAGHILAEEAPFAACYWDAGDKRRFSLRSREDGADVSEIAKRYGGGGHKHAAGFEMPLGWEGDA